MKAVLVFFAVLAAIFGFLYFRERGATHDLENQNKALTARLADQSGKELAAAKLACAGRAQTVFRSMGYSDQGSSGSDFQSYRDHYNPQLKRCLMVLNVTGFSKGAEIVQASLFDADERADFGEYAWVSSPTKKVADQRPMQCHLTPPGKPEAFCHSGDEWDAYVKSLMS